MCELFCELILAFFRHVCHDLRCSVVSVVAMCHVSSSAHSPQPAYCLSFSNFVVTPAWFHLPCASASVQNSFVELQGPSALFPARQPLLDRMASGAGDPGSEYFGLRARVWPGVAVADLQAAVRGYMQDEGEVDLLAVMKVRFSPPLFFVMFSRHVLPTSWL